MKLRSKVWRTAEVYVSAKGPGDYRGLEMAVAAARAEQRETKTSLLRLQELEWWPWSKGTGTGPLRKRPDDSLGRG